MIERCEDYRRLNRLMERVMISHDVFYLVERDGNEDIGVWCLHEWQDGLLMHADMGEKCRGKAARDSGRNALRWIAENTGFSKIYAHTEVKAAQMMAVLIGLKFLYDKGPQRYYGIEI